MRCCATPTWWRCGSRTSRTRAGYGIDRVGPWGSGFSLTPCATAARTAAFTLRGFRSGVRLKPDPELLGSVPGHVPDRAESDGQEQRVLPVGAHTSSVRAYQSVG